MLRISDNFSSAGDFRPFVNYLVFQMNVLADRGVGQNHAVFHNGALLDLAASADYTVFYGALNETAVGYNRILDLRSVKILSRAGVVGSGVNRPVRIEKALSRLKIDQRDISVIIALEIGNACEIASVGNAADVELSSGGFNDLRKSDHG